MAVNAPYGTWSSPLTAKAITKGATVISDVIVDPITSKVYHLENRPSEGGRCVLVDTVAKTDVVGKDWHVRTRVHEYGGSAAIVYAGVAYFSHLNDGRIYSVKAGEEPEPITPEDVSYRFANFEVNQKYPHLLISILEDHTNDTPATVINTLCIIDILTKVVHPLVGGADFYVSPKFSPDGTRLAWQQWNHPDMPWHGASIYVADFSVGYDNTPSVQNIKHVAGEAQKTAAVYPSWADNDTLVFISDETKYANPWKHVNGKNTQLLNQPYDCGRPYFLNWMPYAIVGNGREGSHMLLNIIKEGRDIPCLIDIHGSTEPQFIESPYVTVEVIRSLSRNKLEVVFCGAQVDDGTRVVQLSLGTSSEGKTIVTSKNFVALSQILPDNERTVPRNIISLPRPLTLKTQSGDSLYILFYGPKNPKYSGSSIEGEKPPCIVSVHAGPTIYSYQSFDPFVQYFTSRGFAWLDVNYRGSAGYGRDYRERLDGNWGVLDVNDCILAPQIISSAPYDLIDLKRTVIRGKSSGGFVAMAAITTAPDVNVFAGAAATCGISNLTELAAHAHKLQSRYMDKLIGGYYKDVPDIFQARSPINHTERISVPLLILHGEDDKVVPAEQARFIYEKVLSRGGDVEYKIYPGEGHGWRQESTSIDALEREERFFKRALKLN